MRPLQAASPAGLLAATGFTQAFGVDYFNIFSPVSTYTTVRFIIASSVHYGCERCSLDVESVFLNARLSEEIYVAQPKGFEVCGKEKMVYKLKKALYGLKQASRQWYELLKSTLKTLRFQHSHADPSLFFMNRKGDVLFVVVYVNDFLVTGNDPRDISSFIQNTKTPTYN